MTTLRENSPAVGAQRSTRLTEADCDLAEFVTLVDQTTELSAYRHAARVERNVLIYDSAVLLDAIATAAGKHEVEAELVDAFTNGPGIVVFEGAFLDHDVIDRVTENFDAIIADERARGGPSGDHFATPGANSRVWNALEKLALRDPEGFVSYYANEIVALASRAWLGPSYQMTSQVNVVRPGGQAQKPHRDYHLGFLSAAVVEQFPAHVHALSPMLTLQGAVAHCDMPIESGPTMYLPFSQQYLPGYLAWRLPEFNNYFDKNYVQLPLRKGDAVFFNPAVFHGAGTNVSSDIQRMANLLQVSSAFGQAMERVDRSAMLREIYPVLAHHRSDTAKAQGCANALAAAAFGYPFPSDLDAEQPVGRLTPLSQYEIIEQALNEGWDSAQVDKVL